MKIQFIEGTFADVALSPLGNELFLLEHATVQGTDGVRGYLMTLPQGTRKEVFSSTLHDLAVSWHGTTIYIYERAGAIGQGGVLFAANPKTGAQRRIKVSAEGFSALGGEGMALVDEGGLLSLYDEKSSLESPLSLFTFASKCDFLKALIYCAVPQSLPSRERWYTGEESSNDGVGVSDQEGNAIMLFSPSEGSGHDFIHVRLSARGDFLAVDKKTGLLWRIAVPPPK